MAKQKSMSGIVWRVLAVILIVGLVWLGAHVDISVKHELVGPDDEAMNLLIQKAPLEQIQAAVRRSGKHVDQISYLGGTLLFHAVDKHRVDVAKWLLSEGADPDGTYHGIGGNPLEEAIRQSDEAMVRLLVAAGANPDLDLENNITPRRRAKALGNPVILAALTVGRVTATASTATTPAGD